jgi:hypothetical protein
LAMPEDGEGRVRGLTRTVNPLTMRKVDFPRPCGVVIPGSTAATAIQIGSSHGEPGRQNS